MDPVNLFVVSTTKRPWRNRYSTWALIEPLLPPPKLRRHRYPGRKLLDNRAVLTGILFVLQTGLRWDLLARQIGCGSGMSCWRRLRDWQEAGVWDELLLARLRAADQIDWSHVIVDSSSIRGKLPGAVSLTAADWVNHAGSWSGPFRGFI